MVSIPPQLFGSDDLTRIFPQGMKLPVTGTVEKWKIDTSAIVKQNAAGILGGLIPGNKKNDSTSTQPGGQKPNDLGGLLQDVLGGQKKNQPSDQPQPAQPPKKKKK